jgi:hypothetical protein
VVGCSSDPPPRIHAEAARIVIAPPSGAITSGFTISPTSVTATPIAKLIGQIVAVLDADVSWSGRE